MKKFLAITITVLLSLTLVACSGNDGSTDTKETLVIATSPDYPPYEFINPNDSSVMGADIKLAQYIADALDMELDLKTANFDNLIAGVQTGTYQVTISGFTYDAERAKNVDYSDPYYNEGYQGILVLKENLDKYTTAEAFAGQYITAQSGSLQDTIAKEQLSDSLYTPVSLIPDGVAQLVNGQVEGLVISSAAGEQVMAQNDLVALAPIEFEADDSSTYVLVQKGNEELLKKINAVIAEVKEKGLYEQWFKEAKEQATELGL